MKDNAPFLELPNDQNPKPRGAIKYGNLHVPCPTNTKAKEVNASKVMEQVLKAK